MESAFDANPSPASAQQEDIAIIGMSCIFPGAADIQKFWQNILSKVDAISDPSDQWGAEFFYDPTVQSNDRVYCKRGGYLKDLAEFNPLQYGVMPSSIHGGEPGHFLALRVAYEALADAGYIDKEIDNTKVEVILGKGSAMGPAHMNALQHGFVIDQTLRILKHLHPEHTADELQAIKQELKAGLAPFNAEVVPALVSSIATGRICNRLNFMGANYTVDAACASSLIAVERGIQDLRAGKCEMAVVGGIEPTMPPLGLLLFCQINALSRQGKIRPFDKDAGGTLLGEGVGMVILKRRSDAERDGDRIYALLKGVGISSDGRGAGLLAPRLEGEALAMERAYEDAAISPETVGLIEAHGTGIPLGDVTEIQALTQLFGPRRGFAPSCAVGSVKSMVSHLIHAAGIAGVMKAALALYYNVLPPTLNCDTVNPDLELEQTPFYINTETRPWIHGGDQPRRAGVNSFGFGGINAHAILEQYVNPQGDETASLMPQWETEVCIIQGESRPQLVEAIRRLRSFIAGRADVQLKNIAYSLNCSVPPSAYRLAVVAHSVDELQTKLDHSLQKLADPACASLKDRRGIYFFEQPLASEGKLAFAFPGYGSLYGNMLADLCIHFPELRAHFDNLDKVFLQKNQELLPSQVLFPPPLDQPPDFSRPEHRLWQINFVTCATSTANLAMFDLLWRLGLRPDVVVGHSNGEFTALLACGALRMEGETHFLDQALHFQGVYDSVSEQIPSGKMLAVGDGDPRTVADLLERSRGALHVAMDNCPHQVILSGPEEAISDAYDALVGRGVICNLMPFSQLVHSPAFQSLCDQGVPFFESLPLTPPRKPIYNCTTAELYPQDPAQIRHLAVNHLARPVRFRETVKAMYNDGVRLFVEVGPKGNLTGFVNDTLEDRRYLAVASNVSNRSGITQLNHMIGLLAAHHVPMQLDYLYTRRLPERLSFEATGEPVQAKARKPYTIRLPLELPLLKLASNGLKSNGRASRSEPAASGSLVTNHKTNGHSRPATSDRLPETPACLPLQATVAASATAPLVPANGHTVIENLPAIGPGYNSQSLVMSEYLQTMERFLEAQQVVAEAFLAGKPVQTSSANGVAGKEAAPPGGPAPSPVAQGAFNIAVQSLVAGRELAATCHLDFQEHVFLLDHTLGRALSVKDKSLIGLAVVPLTISMEIMAQTAALLRPGKHLIGMKQVRAHRWIEVNERGCPLALTAKVKNAAFPDEIEVQILSADHPAIAVQQSPLVEGIMVFGDDYPVAPEVAAFTCTPERPYRLRPEQYYELMFHGPCFRCVVSIDQFDQAGMQATMQLPEQARLFRSHENAELLTDPILFDGAGQVIGFWTADRFGGESVVFPTGFDALHIYGPLDYGRAPIQCNARIDTFADGRLSSDIDLLGPGGELRAQLLAWEDRRAFGWTRTYSQFIHAPVEFVYSTQWLQPLADLPAAVPLQCYTVTDGPGGIWPRVTALTILSHRERQQWASLNQPETQRKEWLLSRLAAKDAARVFIKDHYQMTLCPADIEIVIDEHGRAALAAELAQELGGELSISMAYSGGRAVALAGQLGRHRGVGIAIAQPSRGRMESMPAALAPAENELLSKIPAAQQAEWRLRVQCAKEAVAQALGRRSGDVLPHLLMIDAQANNGVVTVALSRELASQLPAFADTPLIAHSGCDGELIFAVSLL